MLKLISEHRTLVASLALLLGIQILLAVLIGYSQETVHLEAAVHGWVAGHVSIVLVFFVLAMRSWIVGWLISCCYYFLSCCLAYLAKRWLVGGEDSLVAVAGQAAIGPAMALAFCLPLTAMRAVRRWLLRRPDRELLPDAPVKPEDWLWFAVVTGSVLAMTGVARANLVAGPANVELYVFCGVAVLVTVFGLPSIAMVFRKQSISSLVVSMLASAIAILVVGVFVTTSGNVMTQRFIVQYTSALAAFGIGVWGILSSGYRLMRNGSSLAIAHESSPELPAVAQAKLAMAAVISRRQTRVLSIMVTSVSLAIVGAQYVLDVGRTSFYRAIQDPAAYYQAAVTEVDIDGAEVTGVRFAESATDADLECVANRTPNIKRLTLSSAKFNDESLKLLRRFPRLVDLDLSHTSVTGAGLNDLSPELAKLSLGFTKVDMPAVWRYCEQSQLQELDLAYANITDEVLQTLPTIECPFRKISLGGNPITDQGVKRLLECVVAIGWLDLSDTAVEGQCLQYEKCPSFLTLDGTKVDDAAIRHSTKSPSWPFSWLSLRRTPVTAEVLPILATGDTSLALGEGPITEHDLMRLPEVVSFEVLQLDSPKFTGECLTTGRIQVDFIDLSHSRVTNQILKGIASQPTLAYLGLAHASINELGIMYLNNVEIDASHTPLSFDRLLLMQPLTVTIHMRHEQLTPGQLLKLQQAGVLVDQPNALER